MERAFRVIAIVYGICILGFIASFIAWDSAFAQLGN